MGINAYMLYVYTHIYVYVYIHKNKQRMCVSNVFVSGACTAFLVAAMAPGISALEPHGRWPLALAVLRDMGDFCVRCRVVTFGSLLNVLRKAAVWDVALRTFGFRC